MNKRAVILAGGKGTRLRPYTVVLPKPLMPIGDYPILELVIRQLLNHGFNHITLAVNHQAELIKAFFGDGSKWNIKIDYSLEDKPLGTMAPLKLIKDLPANFLVMNGDILTDFNFSKFYLDHVNDQILFSISSYKRENKIDYGVLEKDIHDNLIGFNEKPTTSFEVSMGIYLVNSEALKYIPDDQPFGFDDLMHSLLHNQKKVKVNAYSGYWLDIGRPDDYMQAIDEFAHMKSKFINE
jgi:NDP-sugar pyrophosphorylase family protein